MPSSSTFISFLRSQRGALATLVLIAFLASSFGFPVVVRPEKNRSRPFPCQDSPCGCATAEQCWRHCCCRTNRQKLEWAEDHDVEPPDYVIEAARQEYRGEAATLSCSRCDRVDLQASTLAQSKGISPCTRCGMANRPAPKKLQVRIIHSEMARSCQGQARLVTMVEALSLPETPPQWSFDRQFVGRVFEVPRVRRSVHRTPPVPPPEERPAAA